MKVKVIDGQEYEIVFDGRQESLPYPSHPHPLQSAAIVTDMHVDGTVAERKQRYERRRRLLQRLCQNHVD